VWLRSIFCEQSSLSFSCLEFLSAGDFFTVTEYLVHRLCVTRFVYGRYSGTRYRRKCEISRNATHRFSQNFRGFQPFHFRAYEQQISKIVSINFEGEVRANVIRPPHLPNFCLRVLKILWPLKFRGIYFHSKFHSPIPNAGAWGDDHGN